MVDTFPAVPAAALQARFEAVPANVPAARRFVRGCVAGSALDALADDAALCVSELATNAALHGCGGVMEVTVEVQAGGVRISVDDEAGRSSGAVAPRHDYAGGLDGVDDPLTSGRGLAIVSFLAQDWGVTPTARGKRVWAELTTPA